MAVIDVRIDMADVKRLNRLAAGMVPAVDGNAVRFLGQSVAQDNILFYAGHEQTRLCTPPLLLDDLVMLIKRGRRFTILREWPGIELQLGLPINLVGKFAVVNEASAASAIAWAVCGVIGRRKKS